LCAHKVFVKRKNRHHITNTKQENKLLSLSTARFNRFCLAHSPGSYATGRTKYRK
jgi:hypothetical protein